jgi:hypothetical protein
MGPSNRSASIYRAAPEELRRDGDAGRLGFHEQPQSSGSERLYGELNLKRMAAQIVLRHVRVWRRVRMSLPGGEAASLMQAAIASHLLGLGGSHSHGRSGIRAGSPLRHVVITSHPGIPAWPPYGQGRVQVEGPRCARSSRRYHRGRGQSEGRLLELCGQWKCP